MRWMSCVAAAALLATGLLASAPRAQAMPADFLDCDGDSAPKALAPEKAAARGYLGSGERGTSKLVPVLGELGLKACDAALADPSLLPGYWLRRATLLRARASDLIELKRYDEALETLAQSDAAAPVQSAVLFADSVSLGNLVLRGIALGRLGRTAEAAQAFEKAAALRPYSPSLARLVRSSQLFVETDRARRLALTGAAGRLEPRFFGAQFWLALSQGRFADVDALYGQLSFDIPRRHSGWTGSSDVELENSLLDRRGEAAGAVAYARTALDRADAMARVADLRAEIAEMRAPLPANAVDGLRKRHAADLAAADRMEAALQPWLRAIELRAKVKGKTIDVALPLMKAADIKGMPIISDLLRQLAAQDAVGRAQIDAAIRDFDHIFAKASDEILTPDFKDIVRLLPRPEFLSTRPVIKAERSTFGVIMFGEDNNGYKVQADQESGIVDLRFGSEIATGPMVEEATLLVAANYARGHGADGLVLTSTQLVSRTTHVTSYYVGSYDVNAGYELRLTMRLVDSKHLPADLVGNEWRVIGVEDLISKLGPVYTKPKR